MSSSRRAAVVAGAVLALGAGTGLAGCGFQPLYGDHGAKAGAADKLAQVGIANIPNRYGQQLRNNLIDRFYTGHYPDATPIRLEVGLTASEQKLALRKDATAERAQLVVTAPYKLIDSASGRTLLTASSRAYISYNVLDEQYGSLATVDNAYDRALIQISDDITTRVALFLSRGT